MLFAISIGIVGFTAMPSAISQLIYGNTFPFWNVNGPLTVTGTTTLTGALNTTGATSIYGIGTSGVASAGYVGEVLTSTSPLVSSVAMATNVVSGGPCVAITAGDWVIQGIVALSTVSAQFSDIYAGINTNALSNVIGSIGTYTLYPANATLVTGASAVVATTPLVGLNLNATTTYCANARAAYAQGVASVYGVLNARRMR